MITCSTRVRTIGWIIKTVCKHIIAQQALSCAGKRVRVEEAAGFGVVVSRLEVVEAGLVVEYVAAVAQGVNVGMRAEGRGGLAVGIVPVAGCNVAVDIHQPDHVALSVGDVVVDIAVLQQRIAAAIPSF